MNHPIDAGAVVVHGNRPLRRQRTRLHGRRPALSDGEGLCADTCPYADDRICDDGGPYSQSDLCEYGTDCWDCGFRA